MAKIVVRNRGQITLPADVREEMGLQADSVLQVHKISDSAVMLTKPDRMSEITAELQADMKARGLTLDDVLLELKKIRRERWGKRAK